MSNEFNHSILSSFRKLSSVLISDVFYSNGDEMNTMKRLLLLNVKFRGKYYFCHNKRHLYSSSSLGIDSFSNHRKRILESIRNVNAIKGRLKQVSRRESRCTVVLYDLFNMLRVAETEEDLKVFVKLLKKYNLQGDEMLDCFIMGPQVMRLLYVLNKPEEAIKLVEDDGLYGYFQHITTALLLLDMLFENKMYEEVIRCYEYYKERDTLDKILSHNKLHFIFLAACFKLNTPESFEKALQAHMASVKIGRKLPLRQSLLFAALSIKQNQPHCAIKILADFKNHNMVDNYKLMAYAKAKRSEYVTERLKQIVELIKKPDYFITNEALSFIEKELENEESFIKEFKQLKENLAAKNLIVDQPLDYYLFKEKNLYQGKKFTEGEKRENVMSVK